MEAVGLCGLLDVEELACCFVEPLAFLRRGGGRLHLTGCTGDGHGMIAGLGIQTPITTGRLNGRMDPSGGPQLGVRRLLPPWVGGGGRRWARGWGLGGGGGGGGGGGPGPGLGGPGGCGCGKRIREHRQPTPVPTYTHIPGGSPPSHGRIHWHAPVARKPGQVLKKI